MFQEINSILSDLDNKEIFKPMFYKGSTGILKIPTINTVIQDAFAQCFYVTTEERPAVYTSLHTVELLSISDICNKIQLLDGTEITETFLCNNCIHYSMKDALEQVLLQKKILRAKLQDINNTYIEDSIEFIESNIINTVYGSVYILPEMRCKCKDIPVLVYEIPMGVTTAFTASAVFMQDDAPLYNYEVSSTYLMKQYLICPVIDAKPKLQYLIAVDENTYKREFVN